MSDDGTLHVPKVELEPGTKYAAHFKHGQNRRGRVTPEYWIWHAMIQRCRNPKNKRYSSYGGRGIFVCDAWLDSFSAFFSDVGPRPSKEYSLDRIANDEGYFPGNVRWATFTDQARHTRRSKLIAIDGVELPLVAWTQKLGLNYGTVRGRLIRGWPEHQALGLPGGQI
jgi:hypothetical protein